MIRRILIALPAAIILPLLFSQGVVGAPAFAVPSAYEAVLLALESNQSVLAAKLQLEQAAALEQTARASLGWRLDAVGGYRYTDDENVPQLPPPAPPAPTKIHTPHATASLRRSLFPGPSTRLDLENAARNRSIAELEAEAALRSTAIAVYEAYRRLEAALLQYQVALSAGEAARTRVRVVESQHREGTATAIALSEAQLALKESESRAASAQRMLDLAAKQLSHLLNLERELRAEELPAPELSEVLQQIEAGLERYWPDPDLLETGVEQLISGAQERRPEVLKALEHVALAKNEVKRVDVTNRPSFSAELNYAWSEYTSAKLTLDDEGVLTSQATVLKPYDHDTGEAIPAAKDPSWNVGVQVVWNLWDSGVEALSRRRAEAALALAESGAKQARDGVALEVRQKHAELVAAREALITASERALLAAASFDLELEKARVGIGTELQVEAAKVQRDSATASAYAARVDYELAFLRMASSAGLSLDELLEYVKILPGSEDDG